VPAGPGCRQTRRALALAAGGLDAGGPGWVCALTGWLLGLFGSEFRRDGKRRAAFRASLVVGAGAGIAVARAGCRRPRITPVAQSVRGGFCLPSRSAEGKGGIACYRRRRWDSSMRDWERDSRDRLEAWLQCGVARSTGAPPPNPARGPLIGQLFPDARGGVMARDLRLQPPFRRPESDRVGRCRISLPCTYVLKVMRCAGKDCDLPRVSVLFRACVKEPSGT
jgi:hypothetical protein